MGLPTQPVTLTVEQIADLNQKMSTLRHDINNYLSLITAAMEIIQYKPEMLERMSANVVEQPPKIAGAINKFSDEFEKVFGITRSRASAS